MSVRGDRLLDRVGGPTDRRTWAWIVVSAVAVAPFVLYVVRQRYLGAIVVGPGVDFGVFLEAALQVRNGDSPYTIEAYVYSPLVALALAPFTDMPESDLWRAWVILSETALLGACGVCIAALRIPARWVPLVFGAVAVSAFRFWPTTLELLYGNVNSVVVLLLALGAFAATRRSAGGVGSSIGAATLSKTWPIAVGLFILRRADMARRRREALALSVWLGAGLAVILVALGPSGLWDFLVRTFSMSSQPDVIAYSATGFPRLLFEGAGGLEPLVTSSALRIASTCALLLVLGASMLAIVRCGRGLTYVRWWAIAAGVVLLLPVSHSAYRLFLLPLAWGWVAEGLRVRRGLQTLMAVLSVGWWAVTSEVKVGLAGAGMTDAILSFSADLLLVTGTAAALWWIARTGPLSATEGARGSQPAARSESQPAPATGE